MNAVLRTLAGLGAALALVLTLAGTANAASVDVKLGNQATPGRLLTATPNRAVMMLPDGAAGQVWTKVGTTPGFVAYRSALTGECLTGRGLADAPVLTLERCLPASPSQQWRIADANRFHRASGLALEVNGYAVGLGQLTGLANQRWLEKLA